MRIVAAAANLVGRDTLARATPQHLAALPKAGSLASENNSAGSVVAWLAALISTSADSTFGRSGNEDGRRHDADETGRRQ